MTFIHEIGHIAAAIRYGSKTGGIGFGIYFYFPVAYADVHETWNLKLSQRRIVSIAGLYYNLIMLIPFYILGFYLKSKGMIDFIFACHFAVIFVFNPFLKMDGYWFLSDTLGIPNLRTKIQRFKDEFIIPKILNRKNKKNIFATYTRKIKIFLGIYIFLTQIFMLFFMAYIMYIGFTNLINFKELFIDQIVNLVQNFNKNSLNYIIRNALILGIFLRILYSFSKKIISSISKKTIKN